MVASPIVYQSPENVMCEVKSRNFRIFFVCFSILTLCNNSRKFNRRALIKTPMLALLLTGEFTLIVYFFVSFLCSSPACFCPFFLTGLLHSCLCVLCTFLCVIYRLLFLSITVSIRLPFLSPFLLWSFLFLQIKNVCCKNSGRWYVC